MKIWSRFVVVAALACGWSVPLHAEDASAIVNHGIELRRKGRDADALAEFQRALQIEKSPRIQAQAALAEQALGLWEAAEADLLDALGHSGDPWITRNKAALTKALGVIQSHLGTLEVWGTPEGAAITINGKAVGVLPLGKSVSVSGETALLTARAPGYLDVTRSIHVSPGEKIREHVALFAAPPVAAVAPAREPTPPAGASRPTAGGLPPLEQAPPAGDAAPSTPSSGLRRAAWVTGIAAVGGLAFGGVETIIAIQKQNAFNSHLATSSSPPRLDCTTANLNADCRTLHDAYQHAVVLAIVGYGAGAALAIASVVLFEVSPESSRASASVACAPDPTTRGVSCGLRF